MSSFLISLSRYAKLIFNEFFWQFCAVGIICCVIVLHSDFFELWFAVQCSCHLHQCQVRPFFSLVRYSPEFGAIFFHDLPPLIIVLLPPLLFLFLYWKVDCFSWIWLVRARILTFFSDFVSHYPSSTNDSYLTTMLRMKSSRSMFVPLLYFSLNFPM